MRYLLYALALVAWLGDPTWVTSHQNNVPADQLEAVAQVAGYIFVAAGVACGAIQDTIAREGAKTRAMIERR